MPPSEQQAVYALGRLAEAVGASPVAAAWEARARIEATVRLAQADGFGVERDRILRLAYDLPVRQGLIGVADAAITQILDLLSEPLSGAAPPAEGGIRGELAAAEAALGGRANDAIVLYGNLYNWLSSGGRPSVGHVAALRSLAKQGLAPPAAALLARPPALRGPAQAWADRALAGLADAADSGRRDLAALGLAIAEWRRRLGKRRRQSRMEALFLDLAANLVATPAAVARRLGVTVRGASVMLEELAELGIVVEVTGRKSWKAYVVADHPVVAPGDRRAAPATRPSLPPVQPPDMAPLLSDADEAIARAQAAVDHARRRMKEGRGPAVASLSDEDEEEGADQP